MKHSTYHKEQTRSWDLLATVHQLGALLHANLRVLDQLLQMSSVVLWTVIGGSVKWVADLHLLHLAHHTVDETVVDGSFHKETTSCDAVFT